MSDALWPHGLQHARLPRPSSTPWVYSNPCPLTEYFPWYTRPHLPGPLPSTLRTFITPASSSLMLHPLSFLPSKGNSKAPLPAVTSARVIPPLLDGWPSHHSHVNWRVSSNACPPLPYTHSHWHYLIFLTAPTTTETPAPSSVCIIIISLLH